MPKKKWTRAYGSLVVCPSPYRCVEAYHPGRWHAKIDSCLSLARSHQHAHCSRRSTVLPVPNHSYHISDVELSFKLIPWLSPTKPFLPITLRHPRGRRFFPLAREGQARATFAELKLLLVIRMPQIGLQPPGLPSKNKKMKKKMCIIRKSAEEFHFAAVEL